MLDRISDGRTDLVFSYLAAGHAADSKDERGVSLIEWCAYYGDVSAIRFLVENGESLDSLGPNLDLNGAVFHGHWRLVQYLIENGSDVDRALPNTRETPLHQAVSKSGPAYDLVLEVLLAAGANPACATAEAIETGSFMRDVRTRGGTPLHRAAAFASAEAIRMLLEAGASLDTRDMNGDSPLTWASWHGRPAYVLDLLCFGEHRVHPEAVRQSRGAREGKVSGMALHLLGTPHV